MFALNAKFLDLIWPLVTSHWPLLYSAAAPLTISIISFVIVAWRARFMVSVRESMTSLALLLECVVSSFTFRKMRFDRHVASLLVKMAVRTPTPA